MSVLQANSDLQVVEASLAKIVNVAASALADDVKFSVVLAMRCTYELWISLAVTPSV